ncbi:MAG: hypothetical protein IMZ55_03865 [Acidobacteria bacterium]|nr:hypothetical protein [Acidobacteriota bacterium]
MSFVRGFALALALAAIASAMEPPAQQNQSAFAVAMLRRDGVLVPFAVHDGRKWSSPWPSAAYRLEAPLTFQSIQRAWWGRVGPATTWIAWPAGRDPRAVHVRAPVVIPAHCLSTVGLQTDYQSPEIIPPPIQHHHPKDGIATTGNETVEPIELLDGTSPEGARTLDLLTPEIEKAEIRASLIGGWWRTRLTTRRRARNPLTLEVLCRSMRRPDGSVVYYFEAVRRFRPFPDEKPNCEQVAFTQGLVVVGARGLAHSQINTTLTDCDRAEVDFALPLGTMTVNGRQHWIMQFSGRGRERYTIFEIGDRIVRTVVDVLGGGC